MRLPHDARVCAPSGMQRELAPVLVCVCLCDVSLSPPSLLKVREPVEHFRGKGGELVSGQIEPPAEHTRERARGRRGTRVSEDVRGSIAACAGHTTRGYVPPVACRESLRPCLCVCVCVSVMCLSPLPPYPRFVSPLNTVAGRAASSLLDKERTLRNTRERGCGGTCVSEDARGSIAACACHTTRGYVPPAACRESLRPCLCVCVSVMCLSPLPPY